jgi:hypothetical protein
MSKEEKGEERGKEKGEEGRIGEEEKRQTGLKLYQGELQ